MPSQNKMRPIHPGEILSEEYLKPLEMSSNQLATALGVPANRISDIVRGERAVTADTALRLGRFFDTTPEFWMNLQQAYELRIEEVASRKEIAAIKPLAKRVG